MTLDEKIARTFEKLNKYQLEMEDLLILQAQGPKALTEEERDRYNLVKSCKNYEYMTAAEYDFMMKDQGGVCKLCGSSNPGRRGSRRLCIDHDHDTGAVRGLLCNPCNSRLNSMIDAGNPKALAYIILS